MTTIGEQLGPIDFDFGGNTTTYTWSAVGRKMDKDGTETLTGAQIEYLDGSVRIKNSTVVRVGDRITKVEGTYETYDVDERGAHLRVRAEGIVDFGADGNIIVRGSCKGYYTFGYGYEPTHDIEVPEHPNNFTIIREGRIRGVIGKVITTKTTSRQRGVILGSTQFTKYGDIEEVTGVGKKRASIRLYGYNCKADSIKVCGVITLTGHAEAESRDYTLKGMEVKVGGFELTAKSTNPKGPAVYRGVYGDYKPFTGQEITVDTDPFLPSVEVDDKRVW